ncbi:alpha/beta hydrolase [Roseofilum casamattae]|uniref:Alpha/beta hydrolase n=1 Tax=Roseofilum casamattae BLCC-M143 TaxID=3022442 RepID=A0ABT7BTI8_9CYAN|nr:alpha/beta hydrolase [Roseofilum casamattae]MDJ1182506.1 alpha/beta hydrolase [Roseofilum casamattae BLCC-M143]
MPNAIQSIQQRASQWLLRACPVLVTAASLCLGSSAALGAERVVFNYGSVSRSVPVTDLEAFVETGETSSIVNFILNASNSEPEQMRQLLTYDIGLNLLFIDRVFNSLPGEYVLFELGFLFSTKSGNANIQALRSALTLSASDDGRISLLEFLQKYPTEGLYVDGQRVQAVANDAVGFVDRIGVQLELPIAIVKDFLGSVVCECEETP